MRSILIASLISLTVTIGGYIGVVKFTSKRGMGVKKTPEVTAAVDPQVVHVAELQLKGAEEQKTVMLGVQGSLSTMQSNFDIARNILLEEQRKLETLRESIRHESVEMVEQNEGALRKLAKLYESMKPAEAAELADRLDTGLVVEIIPRMKERSAAKMLSAMDTKRAV